MKEGKMRQDGFTLIEIMIALVITSLVLTMVYSSFSAVMDTRERVMKASDLDTTARLVLTRLTRELESAFLVKRPEELPPESRYTIFEGSQENVDQRPADRISFTTFAHVKRGVDADESDQALISYEVEALPAEPGYAEPLALIRREWRRIAPPGETQFYEPRPIPLAEDIQGFRVRFLDEEGEWVEDWNSTDIRMLDLLPVAVEITLTLRDERGFERDYVTVASPKIAPFDREDVPAGEGETLLEEEKEEEEEGTEPADDQQGQTGNKQGGNP
jgi:general secretion pathway protein J